MAFDPRMPAMPASRPEVQELMLPLLPHPHCCNPSSCANIFGSMVTTLTRPLAASTFSYCVARTEAWMDGRTRFGFSFYI